MKANQQHSDVPSTPIEDFDERYERAFGLLAFACNRFILNYMRRISIELDMDLETTLIWGTLAQMNVLANVPMDANPMTVLDDLGTKNDMKLSPLRLSDLTQITGLPRETVRRKLEKLAGMGKVQRTEGSRWVFVQEAIGDPERRFTKQSVQDLMSTAQSLQRLLEAVSLSSKQGDANVPLQDKTHHRKGA